MPRKRVSRHGKGNNGVGERPSREWNSKARDMRRRRIELEAKELDAVAAKYNIGDMVDYETERGEVIDVDNDTPRGGRQALLVRFEDGRKEFIDNGNVTRA